MERVFQKTGRALIFTLAGMSSVVHAQSPDADDARVASSGKPTVSSKPSYQDSRGRIRIVGTSELGAVVGQLNGLVQAESPKLGFFNELNGSGGAVPMLTHGRALLAVMDRPISRFEKVPYRKFVGGEPVQVRVAHGVSNTFRKVETTQGVYVNRVNPIKQLSIEQVTRVLAVGNTDGDYSRWGQLGLEHGWRDRPIQPYGPHEYSHFAIKNLHGLSRNPRYESFDTTQEIVSHLANDPSGIAVANVGLVDEHTKQVAIIDSASGRSTSGTPGEIRNSSYPYGEFLYISLRKFPGQPADPIALEYVRAALSKKGQSVFAKSNGYQPLTAAEIDLELQVLKEAARP